MILILIMVPVQTRFKSDSMEPEAVMGTLELNFATILLIGLVVIQVSLPLDGRLATRQPTAKSQSREKRLSSALRVSPTSVILASLAGM